MKKKLIEIKSRIIGIFIGLIMGVALILTGCGDEATSEASEGRVVESIDDDGNVIEAAEEISKEAEQSDETVAEALDEVMKAPDSIDDTIDIIREVEQMGSAKDYLEYMSEDELRELALEALTNAGLDTRLAEGRMKTYGVTFDVPEGFEEYDQVKGMYVTGRYPIDATNIYYSESKVNYTLQLMDQDYFKEMIEQMYASDNTGDVDVQIKEFELIKVTGVPTFRIVAEYDLDEYHFIHLIYVINGSTTYTIVYTETTEFDDRMELFEESAATMKVKR